ncbi:hypothetical protein ACIBF6_16910 [Streptosporangium amethystogenes]|uniref:hypothetical protein n=1 Tax=Streptosporangium amethystogenes TaxID=2002 RepID=UPI0037B9656D
MTLWTEICDLVTRNQVTRLADRLVMLTEEERAELGGRFPASSRSCAVSTPSGCAPIIPTTSRRWPPGRSAACSTDWPTRCC